jgi:hypothetical protein
MITPLRKATERNKWIYFHSGWLICCDQRPRNVKISKRANLLEVFETMGKMLDITTKNEAILQAASQILIHG